MDNLNYIFFEEFKELDKICGELYDTNHGVTGYIDDMKAKSMINYNSVPYWNSDLEQLLRLRHIRNKLAHEEGAFSDETCTQKDIDWIRDFHKRILNQTDPLSLLFHNLQTKTSDTKQIIKGKIKLNNDAQQDNKYEKKVKAPQPYINDFVNNQDDKRNKLPIARIIFLITLLILTITVVSVLC